MKSPSKQTRSSSVYQFKFVPTVGEHDIEKFLPREVLALTHISLAVEEIRRGVEGIVHQLENQDTVAACPVVAVWLHAEARLQVFRLHDEKPLVSRVGGVMSTGVRRGW